MARPMQQLKSPTSRTEKGPDQHGFYGEPKEGLAENQPRRADRGVAPQGNGSTQPMDPADLSRLLALLARGFPAIVFFRRLRTNDNGAAWRSLLGMDGMAGRPIAGVFVNDGHIPRSADESCDAGHNPVSAALDCARRHRPSALGCSSHMVGAGLGTHLRGARHHGCNLPLREAHVRNAPKRRQHRSPPHRHRPSPSSGRRSPPPR
jgi:hypothetical protein